MKKIRFSGIARKWCGVPYTEVLSLHRGGVWEQVLWHTNTYYSCYAGFRAAHSALVETDLELK